MTRITGFFLLRFVLLLALFGCTRASAPGKPEVNLRVLSGSENESLEPLIREFSSEHGIKVELIYKGSIEIMQALQQDDCPFDAVWPANSIWISMGDRHRRVKHLSSIMSSPVVLGIRKSLVEKLGFRRKDVKTAEILDAVRNKRFSFMMTSATQSNSGAAAYLGFLYALAGNPEVLTREHLQQEDLRKSITELLSGTNRSSGSSGWLKDLFLSGNYDAMINYESMIIEANVELVRRGREPLFVVYPIDGIVMADSPLGFISGKQTAGKEEAFLKLQKYLLSEPVQAKLQRQGRRTGFGGILGTVDRAVFNPEWGIDPERILSPIRMPAPEIITEALHLYQTSFRKPSYTIFCLDYSTSMRGAGEDALKQAMHLLLDRDEAARHMLQTGLRDRMTVIAFSDQILAFWSAQGGDPASLQALDRAIRLQPVNGATDIHTPVISALRELAAVPELSDYIPAVILMTDGVSNKGPGFVAVQKAFSEAGLDVPVFAILFGAASETQLRPITELTRGRIFDGRKNLVEAFRKVKGYN